MAAAAGCALLAIGCGAQDTHPCNDGLDNDGDLAIDMDDPGCLVNGRAESPNPELPACRDYLDNDGDGLVDAADPGCKTPDDPREDDDGAPDCRDFIDNDGDGLIDYPFDPGCSVGVEASEDDDCPLGRKCPQCGNRVDDDGDGMMDYEGGDPGCTSAADPIERDPCIPGVELIPLDVTGAAGDTSGLRDRFRGSCGGLGRGEDVYVFDLDRTLRTLSLSTEGAAFDTVTYVRYGVCASDAAEVACADPGSRGETVTIADPAPGEYFVFVDGSFASGAYSLAVSGTIAAGDACDAADTRFVCEPGTFCDGVACVAFLCSNGVDDDGDGKIDFPDDPGCADGDDNDEADDCPDGPGCPQCGNGIDDDGDGDIDFPADPGCAAASDDLEVECDGESDPIVVITNATTTGSTAGLTNDFAPSCSSSSTAPEQVLALHTLAPLSTLRIDTNGSSYDTVLMVRSPSCDGPDLACNDDGGEGTRSLVTLTDVPPGEYLVFVDGFSSNAGSYVLNVSGEIPLGGACDAASEVFVCEPGSVCEGGVCSPGPCANGIDDDGDGKIDFPDDPGCADTLDGDEADDCPAGPACPQCSNGADDDADGDVDYPADAGCDAASDDSEIECAGESDPIVTITGATTAGSTAGLTHDFVPSCSTGSTAPEQVLVLETLAPLSTLRIDTNGSSYDTVLMVKSPTCGDPDLACDDDGGEGTRSLVTLTDPAPGTYLVFVDGFSSSSGSYVLNVSGEIPPGGACDPASEVFVCGPGAVCSGGVCAPAQCANEIDDDGDGKVDALDPGCVDAADDDETDDCPAGPACPLCSNEIDDDGDALIDADDFGCDTPTDGDEADCVESDPIEVIAGPVTTGTTAGATGDHLASCASSAAPERVFALDVPGDLASLDIDLGGSGYDTVLYVKARNCDAPDLACNDDAIGAQSAVSLEAAPAGRYLVFVDGFSSNAGAFTLNVSGVIAAGQPCDPAQVASGMLSCAGGGVCQDPGAGFVCE